MLRCRSRWIDGSATLTTLLSRYVMKVPSATATSAHNRRFRSIPLSPVRRPCTLSLYTVHVPGTSDLYVVWLSSGGGKIDQGGGGGTGPAARRRGGPRG